MYLKKANKPILKKKKKQIAYIAHIQEQLDKL